MSPQARDAQASAGVVAAIVVAFAFGYGICYFFLVFPKQRLAQQQYEMLEDRQRLAVEQLEQLQLMTNMSEEQLVEWVARTREVNHRFTEVMAEFGRREARIASPAVWLTALVTATALIGFLVTTWLVRDANADAATTIRNIANAAPPEIVKMCVRERLDRRDRAAVAPAPAAAAATEMTGIVKSFNVRKGFGFIVPDNGDRDVFFHISGVDLESRERIEQGIRLQYRTREGARGVEAINIELA
ncbi:MAG: cold shock domain-containing protein [Planctomycetota bacterium]|jgi:CspA family cold shock protein